MKADVRLKSKRSVINAAKLLEVVCKHPLKVHGAIVGKRLFLYDDKTKSRVERRMIRRAIQTGESIFQGDTQTRYDWKAVINPGKSGSEVYTWKDEKVLAELVKTTYEGKGKDIVLQGREVVKTGWRNIDMVD